MQIKVPDHLALMPFQVDAVTQMLTFLKSEIAGCYNCCEVGLGKSIQTIATLNTLKLKKVLIIAPAIMRITWLRELQKWSTIEPHILVVETGDDIKGIGRSDYTIISYDLATRYVKEIAPYCWDALVLDESAFLKSHKAKRTRAILDEIWPKAAYHICLSATPFLQSIVDGFTLFNALDSASFPDFWSFVGNWSYSKVTPWGTQYYGVKNPEMLSKILRSSFYIRYKKEEVLKDLPPKTYVPITLDSSYNVTYSKEEREAIEKYKRDMKQAYARGAHRMPQAPESLAKKRHLEGERKVPAVVSFVADLLEQKIPVVLFAYHRTVITKYMEAFAACEPSMIWGDTSPTNRTIAIDNFQEGRTLLFIAQMQAASLGITLTKGSTCVFAELDYSPATLTQCVGRLHRISQVNPVLAYYFQVDGGIDQDIIEIVVEKAKAFREVLDEKAVA